VGDAAMLKLLSRQSSDAGLGPRRRCARGAAAQIISTYAKWPPLHSRREPTARESSKLADEKVAACKVAKEDFDASLKQLRFKLLSAKGQVEGKARDEVGRRQGGRGRFPRIDRS
jgi:hypothetical protein